MSFTPSITSPADPAAARKKGLTRFEASLIDDIVAFQHTAYPHRRRDWIEPRWRWMFLDSARRLGVEPMVWLYHDGTQVLAHQGGIPVRLKVDAQERLTGWFVETMALESARGRTVGPSVIMKATEELPFNLSLGQTAPMRELQYRLGWKKVADLQTAQLLLNPFIVLRQKMKWPVASLAAAIFQIRSAASRARRPSLIDFEVTEIDKFGAAHDGLWDRVQQELGCAVVRDAAYLNWKYRDQPGQDFHRLELRRNGESVAVVIMSFHEPNDIYRYRRAFLVDLVAPLDDATILDSAIELARQHAVRNSADSLICYHIHHHLNAALQRSGYIMRDPTRSLLVRTTAADDGVSASVLNAANWYVMMGDSDIDRPW